MSNREPTATTPLDKVSATEPLAWKRARDLLDAGALNEAASFVGTVRPDGRPHSARIGAAWCGGDVYFQTGQQTRKARNLEVNLACTLSTSLTGIDLVFEGLAERMTDGPTLEAVAAVWREGGWAAEVSGDGIVAPYNAPGTGPPPWQVYRVAAATVIGVATAEPYGATRWRFEAQTRHARNQRSLDPEGTEMSDAIQLPQTRAEVAAQLADRYMALWNEPNADRRRQMIAELWTEDGSQILQPPREMREIAASPGIGLAATLEARGHTELQARAATSYEHWVGSHGLGFRARGDAQRLGDVVKFRWEAVADDGSTAAAGLNVLVLAADGRVQRNYTFVDGA